MRAVLLAVLAAAIYVAARSTRDLTDFAVYHTAAIRAESAEELYRPEDGHFQFKYLPAFAIVLTPLAHVPLEVVKAGWFALMFWSLVAFFRLSIDSLPARHRPAPAVAWLTLLVMARYYIRELTLGQTNVLLGAIIVFAAVVAARARPAAAGASVGAAVVVKPYALLLIPWVGVGAGLGALAAALAVLALVLGLPAVSYGWKGNLGQLAGWYRTVSDTTATGLLFPESVSLAAFWAKWLGIGRVASTLAALSVVATLAVLAFLSTKRRTIESPWFLEASALLLCMHLISPQGWDYGLLLGTPAVMVLLDRWTRTPRSWRVAIVAALVLIALPTREIFGLTFHRALMSTGVMTVAGFGLLAALVRLRLRALA